LWLLFPAAGVAEERGWQPDRTWVFVIGVLEWKHSEVYGSFPVKARRDAELVEFFKLQNVPAEQIVYLQDKKATAAEIKAALSTLLAKTKEGDLLFLYYCGHGHKPDTASTFFASYDAGDKDVPGWSVSSIVADIERDFKGARAILTADCCYSGTLAQEAQKEDHRVSYAVLASSSASESSTDKWTFTEALLSGLRGRAFVDLDGDGCVTIEEMGTNIEEDMAFADGQRATFATTGGFPPGTVMSKAGAKSSADCGRRVGVLWGDKWWKAQVIDFKEGKSRIHYYWWDESWDEWVTADRIREAKLVEYEIGSEVEVEWHGKWYPAEVLKVDRGVHLIHYTGYDSSWDEWVSPKRIREPGTEEK
ncbi:MAG: Tudor-knot domain-containing protein, partial [Planctomycetota bacterium]|nr:Tudor-knot domain-containing protein [Planctomycetota bacterium]